eukprot:scaffold294762_cov17-Tisochrysis_lutea.AAC.2
MGKTRGGEGRGRESAKDAQARPDQTGFSCRHKSVRVLVDRQGMMRKPALEVYKPNIMWLIKTMTG